MNRIDWEHVIAALKECRYNEVPPDMWNQFAEIVELFVHAKAEEVTAVLRSPAGYKRSNSSKDKSSRKVPVEWSSPFAEMLQYHIQRTPGLSLEKCYQVFYCYEMLRATGMKTLEAKIKVAEMLNLKLGHKSIGAILKAVSRVP